MPRRYDKKTPSFCAHCGDEVTNAGRAGKSGKRYCQKLECRAAKARADRKYQAAFQPDRDAPTSCAGCGKSLPARRWRSSDEFGRWCTKSACLARRDDARKQAQVINVADMIKKVDRLELVITFLQEVVMADSEDYMLAGRTVCRVCGLTSAITGWVHPTTDGTACMGTLGSAAAKNIGRQGLAGAWPFAKTWLTPTELAEAYGD